MGRYGTEVLTYAAQHFALDAVIWVSPITVMGETQITASRATQHCAPKAKLPKKQTWNGDVSRAMASNKEALQEWNRLGRPSEGLLWDNRKTTKQRLRKALRQANAEKRNKLYHDVMSANSHDTRLFHQLIQKQKNSKTLSGDRLMVNGELITSHSAVTQAWDRALYCSCYTPQAQTGSR